MRGRWTISRVALVGLRRIGRSILQRDAAIDVSLDSEDFGASSSLAGSFDTDQTCQPVRIVERLRRSPVPTFLAVLKKMGRSSPGALSFPLEGWTLAVDLPCAGRALNDLLDECDRDVLSVGGRVYLAKDARLPREVFTEMYPRLEQWRAVRDRLDPDGRLSTDLGRRLGLSW